MSSAKSPTIASYSSQWRKKLDLNSQNAVCVTLIVFCWCSVSVYQATGRWTIPKINNVCCGVCFYVRVCVCVCVCVCLFVYSNLIRELWTMDQRELVLSFSASHDGSSSMYTVLSLTTCLHVCSLAACRIALYSVRNLSICIVSF